MALTSPEPCCYCNRWTYATDSEGDAACGPDEGCSLIKVKGSRARHRTRAVVPVTNYKNRPIAAEEKDRIRALYNQGLRGNALHKAVGGGMTYAKLDGLLRRMGLGPSVSDTWPEELKAKIFELMASGHLQKEIAALVDKPLALVTQFIGRQRALGAEVPKGRIWVKSDIDRLRGLYLSGLRGKDLQKAFDPNVTKSALEGLLRRNRITVALNGWPADLVDTVVRMDKAGVPQKDISEAVGKSRSVICHFLRKYKEDQELVANVLSATG